MSPRLRGLLANIALTGGALAVVLLGLEAALRFTGFAPERERAVRRMVDARWTTLLDCFPSNPRGYFDLDLRRQENRARYQRLAPQRFDAIARHHPWAVESRYNSLRFRDAPLGAKPPGVRRIVVLGDSFAEGQGVKESDTVARVLARLLEDRAPGRYEVRNCGRRGADFPEIYGAFEDVLPYEPDLVVYTLTLNDAVQPPEFRERQTYLNDWILDRTNVPDDPDAARPGFRPRVFDFFSDRMGALVTGRETTRWYLDMWGDANRAGWERTQEYLREMKRRLNLTGARLLVAPWPLFVGLDRGYPFAPAHEAIHRFCLVAQIPHHDLLPVFRGRPILRLLGASGGLPPERGGPPDGRRVAAPGRAGARRPLKTPEATGRPHCGRLTRQRRGELGLSPQRSARSAPSSARPRHSKRLRTCWPRRSPRAGVARTAATSARASAAASSAARSASSAGGSSSNPRKRCSRASNAAASGAAWPLPASPNAPSTSSDRPIRCVIVRAWGRLTRTQRW